ncbi:hypothetical protein Tco_1578178 [Tanacetum coccineum]
MDAAHRKRVKYEAKCADIGYSFLPFSFSSLGELEKDAVALLKRIRKFSVTQDIRARTAVHIFNRISFVIVKGVGAQIKTAKLKPSEGFLLIQFRLVSKPWKSLIDCSEFIANYHVRKTQPQHRLLVSYAHTYSEEKYVSIADDDTFPQHTFPLTVPVSVEQLMEPTIVTSQGLVQGAWRRLAVNLPRKSIAFTENNVAIDRFIYWHAYHWFNVIVSFDMMSEEFMENGLPNSLALDLESQLFISKLGNLWLWFQNR